MMKTILTSDAPEAIGPYSQAVAIGSLLYVSGQLPIDPATGEFPSEEASDQTRQCLRNLAAIAAAAGTGLTHCVKTTVMVRDLTKFSEINAAYAEFFSAPCPARATFEVSALPRGANVEIEAIFWIPDDQGAA